MVLRLNAGAARWPLSAATPTQHYGRTEYATVAADLLHRCRTRPTPGARSVLRRPRGNLYRLIDEVSESHRPVLIAGKRSSAVLVSSQDWEAIQETLYLLSVPGMRESIKKGMAEPLEKSAREVKW